MQTNVLSGPRVILKAGGNTLSEYMGNGATTLASLTPSDHLTVNGTRYIICQRDVSVDESATLTVVLRLNLHA